eukprot:5521137-Prymnesium_polylepis.2
MGTGADTQRRASQEHKHHQLFGEASHHAPHLFLNLIKFHTWLLVLTLTFGVQIIVPSLVRLCEVGYAAAPPGTIPELLVYSSACLLTLVLLVRLTPATVSLYSLVTTVEGFRQDWAILEVCKKHGWRAP